MDTIVKDILLFWKNPKIVGVKTFENKENRITYFALLMILLFIIQFSYGLLTSLLAMIFDFEINKPVHNFGKMHDRFGFFFLPFVYLGVPLMEETISRLCLSFKRLHVAISIAAALAFLILVLRTYILLPLALLPFLLFYLVAKDDAMLRFKERYGNITIYIVSLIFISLHYPGWEDAGTSPIFTYSIAFISYSIAVIFLVFTRIRLGFLWAVLMHALVNFVPISMALLES